MSNVEFTVDQIGKLREIEKARIKTGEPGLRLEVQALIARLQSGGVGIKTDDSREAQAKRLYDNGFGSGLPFAEYLESIPPVPDYSEGYAERFPVLVLVDSRMSISTICSLLGIEFRGDNETFVDFDPKTAKTDKVYWIRVQDDVKYNRESVQACRKSIAEDEVGLTAYEGLAYLVQNPKLFNGRFMDLLGSVPRENRAQAAYLGGYCMLKLDWRTGGYADPVYSFACRMK